MNANRKTGVAMFKVNKMIDLHRHNNEYTIYKMLEALKVPALELEERGLDCRKHPLDLTIRELNEVINEVSK